MPLKQLLSLAFTDAVWAFFFILKSGPWMWETYFRKKKYSFGSLQIWLVFQIRTYLWIWVGSWKCGCHVTVFSCDQAALQMVFSVRPSVRPSVRLSHLFDYVLIIVSSWNFQELLPMTKVRSMQKVKVRGQRSRSQRSQPNLTVSRL